MPKFPDGLEIDHSKPLNGTMAPYAEQLLVCTGQRDWTSRVEDENGGENIVADVKELVGRGGEYADPFHNTPLIASSFPSTPLPKKIPESIKDHPTTSAYLLPSFKYLPFLPRSSEGVTGLVKGYLQPKKLHPAHSGLSPIHQDRLRRSEAAQSALPPAQEVEDVLVLICGHRGRDARCGILGPVLESALKSTLPKLGIEVLDGAVPLKTEGQPSEEQKKMRARVGLISHIGGHQFAGNVIFYIPPSARLPSGEAHPLSGMGIWYGRVEPKHVEGLIKTTLQEGKVVEALFRGGVQKGKGVLHMPSAPLKRARK